MKPFAYARPKDAKEAFGLLTGDARAKGGGVDLLDLAKNGISTPQTMVDVRLLEFMQVLQPTGPGGLALGAGVTLARLASDPLVARECPALAEAAAQAATPQVRALATLAGNLLQRPRCAYFRDPFFDCLKRGGKTCPAMEGDHSEGAIFGNGKCCAVHPSNLAVVLLAVGADISILTGIDEKEGGFIVTQGTYDARFFVSPEEDPLREARLAPGAVILWLALPSARASAYVEVDQKQSFDWASASCAVALEIEGGKVKSARVALGAVAPVPMLSEGAAQALIGKVANEKAAEAAADAAVKGATPLRDNAHKVQHLRVCVKRAVLKAAERGR